MNAIPSEGVKEDIFSMSISQTQDVAHHGHHSSGATVGRTTAVPVRSYMFVFVQKLQQAFFKMFAVVTVTVPQWVVP